MARKKSPQLLAALADIELGMTPYRAALVHGISQSSISRALHPRVKLTCASCGNRLKSPSITA